MSLWGFDGEENPLTSWPSLSQFDDVEWSEFGDNANHVLPNAASPPTSWLPNEDRRKRMHREHSLSESIAKREAPASTCVAHSVTGMSSEDDGSKNLLFLGNTNSLPSTFVEGQWSNVAPVEVDIPDSKPFSSGVRLVSRETADNCDESVKDHENMIVVNEGAENYPDVKNIKLVSDPLSVPDASSQDGSLPMFTGENVAGKADSLLELDWEENMGNLYDMDKLFRNDTAAPFEPPVVSGTDTLDWPSPSRSTVNALNGSVQYNNNSPLSESSLVKIESDGSGNKAETVFECVPELAIARLDDVVNDSKSPKSLKTSPDSPLKPPSHPGIEGQESSHSKAKSSASGRSGRETSEDKEGTSMSSDAFRGAEKDNLTQGCRARRQPAQRKRNEDKSRKMTSYRKLFPGPPYSVPQPDVRLLQSVPLRLGGQSHPLQTPNAVPLQCLPPGRAGGLHSFQQAHGSPYIHPGYPLQFVPGMSSCPPAQLLHMQPFQPRMVDLMRSSAMGERPGTWLNQPSPLASSQPFDAPIRPPPSSSPNMTPEEKLEKLRWRQQMQARMAVEQQQQLLASQSGEGPELTVYDKQQEVMARGLLPNNAEGLVALNPTGDHPMNAPMTADPRIVTADGSVVQTSEHLGGTYTLESSVLGQLKSTVTALDLGTRLCIRDALFRLANSAMKRRAAGSESGIGGQESQEQDSDANAVESSTASGPLGSQHSRDSSMSVVETETNPIDRSIANLLFTNPHQAPVYGRPYVYT